MDGTVSASSPTLPRGSGASGVVHDHGAHPRNWAGEAAGFDVLLQDVAGEDAAADLRSAGVVQDRRAATANLAAEPGPGLGRPGLPSRGGTRTDDKSWLSTTSGGCCMRERTRVGATPKKLRSGGPAPDARCGPARDGPAYPRRAAGSHRRGAPRRPAWGRSANQGRSSTAAGRWAAGQGSARSPLSATFVMKPQWECTVPLGLPLVPEV